MEPRARPLQAHIFAGLLAVAALCMAWLGSMAAGYFVPAIVLALQAALLWGGRYRRLFEGIMAANQLSGALFVLVLWLGGGLGDLKLDISGVALLVNLATGGPLMTMLSIPLLALLRLGPDLLTRLRLTPDLSAWFGAGRAAPLTAATENWE